MILKLARGTDIQQQPTFQRTIKNLWDDMFPSMRIHISINTKIKIKIRIKIKIKIKIKIAASRLWIARG